MSTIIYPSTMRLNGMEYLSNGGMGIWWIDTATGLGPLATVLIADFNQDFNNDFGPPGSFKIPVNPE